MNLHNDPSGQTNLSACRDQLKKYQDNKPKVESLGEMEEHHVKLVHRDFQSLKQTTLS